MPFAICKSVSMPIKMVPRTLHQPKKLENIKHEEETQSSSIQEKPTKKNGLLISTANIDTEDNL